MLEDESGYSLFAQASNLGWLRHWLQQNKWGDHLWQGGPSMAALDGPARPSMATKSAMDGLAGSVVVGDHLRHDRSLKELILILMIFH